MATKNYCLSLKNKSHFSVVDNISSDRFSNLNLNQNYQFSNTNQLPTKIATTDSKKVQNYDLTECNNLQTSKSSLAFDGLKKNLPSNYYLNVDHDGIEKKELKNNSSNSINHSTLSLHISAYENSHAAISINPHNINEKIGLKKKQGLIKKREDAKQAYAVFEFPRQQEKDDQANPEVMQFKPSQKLLNPKQSSANDQHAKERKITETRMMSGSDKPPPGNQSGGNGIRRLWMGKNVEQTKMAPDFVKNVEAYDSYKESVDLLVDRLEIAVQQNPNVLAASIIECPPNENPHEKTAASLAIFHTYFNQEKQHAVRELIEENKKLAQIERAGQVQARKAIRHLRRFYIEQYKEASDERNKLNKAREHMDLMKHEVKQAKTTEQIEKKAVLYEEAVQAFDAQATKVIECLGQLPTIQQTHVKDIVEYFDTIGQFHTKMGAAIAKRDF